MLTFWIHLVAFWQVAVMNCIQPVNWKYCYRVDQWLIPDWYMHGRLKLVSMYHIKMRKNTWRVNPIGDGTALEKRRGVKALGSSTLPLSVFCRKY